MESILNKIGELDKETSRDLRLIMDMSYNCIRVAIRDEEQQERLLEIVDAISDAAKARINEIATKELENI